jgi:hypothetical protein
MCRKYDPRELLEQTTQSDVIHNWSVSVTRGRRETLLISFELDMELPPDSLEVGGFNDLLVVVTVDEYFSSEQRVSGSFSDREEVQTQTLSSYRSYYDHSMLTELGCCVFDRLEVRVVQGSSIPILRTSSTKVARSSCHWFVPRSADLLLFSRDHCARTMFFF